MLRYEPIDCSCSLSLTLSLQGQPLETCTEMRHSLIVLTETAMHRLAMTLIFAGLMWPISALAGTPKQTFTATQEKGVTVYRGQTSKHNYRVMAAVQERQKLREEQVQIKSRLAAQERSLRAQQQSLDDVQTRLDQKEAQTRPKRRSRYGRSYVGNNRFFGRNGFIGNSNFSGATQPLPSPYRRKYQRRHHKSNGS